MLHWPWKNLNPTRLLFTTNPVTHPSLSIPSPSPWVVDHPKRSTSRSLQDPPPVSNTRWRGGRDPERISFLSLQPESENGCPLSGQKVKMNPCLVQTLLEAIFGKKKRKMHRKQYMKSMGGKRASQPTWTILSRWPDQRDSFKYEHLGDTTDWEGRFFFFFAESGIIGYFLTQSEAPISDGGAVELYNFCPGYNPIEMDHSQQTRSCWPSLEQTPRSNTVPLRCPCYEETWRECLFGKQMDARASSFFVF